VGRDVDGRLAQRTHPTPAGSSPGTHGDAAFGPRPARATGVLRHPAATGSPTRADLPPGWLGSLRAETTTARTGPGRRGSAVIAGARTFAGVTLVWVTLATLAHLLLQTTTAGADELDEAALDRGAGIYQANCAACHGTVAEGGPGTTADTSGPALDETDIAFIDMTLRTGRMPYPSRAAGVLREELDDDEREAVVAWMADRFDLPGEIPEVGEGDAARGQELYVRNCAACHGAAGDGGISGAGVTVPPIDGLEPVATVEAIRVGPFEMPGFSEQVLDEQQVADIAAFVEQTDDGPRTLLGLHEVDRIVAALFAGALALAVLVVLLVTDRARTVSRHGGPGPAPGLPRDATAGDEVDP
jgi:ubiquinol-cytochrome c reductase cytochrome c subunit